MRWERLRAIARRDVLTRIVAWGVAGGWELFRT